MSEGKSKSDLGSSSDAEEENEFARLASKSNRDASQMILDTSPLPDDVLKREKKVEPNSSGYVRPARSPRSRHAPSSLDSLEWERVEQSLALTRNRHSLLPKAFEVKRLERWLDKGDGKQIEWARGYLWKSFRGFPLPAEVSSNKEIVTFWFRLSDVSDAIKSKLFEQMTNAWNQKVKRARRKAEGIHSVELSSERMKELKTLASDSGVSVTEALNEVVKVAYENKKQFQRQSAKMKKAALEKMRLEIRGTDS